MRLLLEFLSWAGLQAALSPVLRLLSLLLGQRVGQGTFPRVMADAQEGILTTRTHARAHTCTHTLEHLHTHFKPLLEITHLLTFL